MTEIWFTPNDETTIEDIFESMKHCQSLHPDENGKQKQPQIAKRWNIWSEFYILPLFFLLHYADSFSDEEDEFIMAEDNAAADAEVAQGELRNLHIEGNGQQNLSHWCVCVPQSSISFCHFHFADDERFADAEEE